MPTATKPRLATADNGYFMVYELPCGCRVRITTEYDQWGLRHGTPARKEAIRSSYRAELARRVERHVCPS